MNIFLKQKMPMLVIVLLVILNAFTLYIIWDMQKNKPVAGLPLGPPAQRTSRFLQSELGLSDQQMQQLDRIRQQHARKAQNINVEIRTLKKQLMDLVFEDTVDSALVKMLSEQIGDKQTEMERLTFAHFQELKTFCEANQVDKLRQLVGEFFQMHPPQGQEGGRPAPPAAGQRPPRF